MSKLSLESKAWLRSNDPARKFSAKRFRKQSAARRDKILQDCQGLDEASVHAKRRAENLCPMVGV